MVIEIQSKNKCNGNKKANSGGIRIIREDHYIEDNLMINLYGNGTLRCGISMNCGVRDSPLNRYFQVLRAQVKNNIMHNCKDGMAIGVEKKEANLKPKDCLFENNFICNCDEAFSSDSDVKGAETSQWIGNKVK